MVRRGDVSACRQVSQVSHPPQAPAWMKSLWVDPRIPQHAEKALAIDSGASSRVSHLVPAAFSLAFPTQPD